MNKENTGMFQACFVLIMVLVVLILPAVADAALDIHSIYIYETIYHYGDEVISPDYEFSVFVNGTGITAVTLETPDNIVYNLEASSFIEDVWELEDGDYATLTDLHDVYPHGDYTFTFNITDSVELNHDPTELAETDFANITYPVDESTNVPLNPTFTWSYTGSGDALTMSLADEEDYSMIYIEWFADISQTSWTPGPLEPGHQYSLEVSVLTGSTPSGLIHGQDNYNYYDLFENCHEVLFTTTAIQVAIDIKPHTCPNKLNTKSKGLLTVAILGSGELDVETIDPASVMLNEISVSTNGISAIRSSIKDILTSAESCSCEGIIEPDTYPELIVKFEIEALVETLGEVNVGDVIELLLTGVLYDGTPIEGSDCILIRGKPGITEE